MYNIHGQLLTTFPTDHIQTPSGVCTDSVGRVMVADQATHTVQLYTIDGQYIQQVAKLDNSLYPRAISLYEDRLLAVGTGSHTVVMYGLEWEG